MSKNKYSKFKKVTVGGISKKKLLQSLSDKKIGLNIYAHQILSHPNFKFTKQQKTYSTCLVKVKDLELSSGGTLKEIFQAGEKFGLKLCPPDLALYLRIKYLNQPEGAIRIAMNKINNEKDFPDGFYLRSEKGLLWLRAHKAEKDYKWKPEAEFVFVKH